MQDWQIISAEVFGITWNHRMTQRHATWSCMSVEGGAALMDSQVWCLLMTADAT